MPKIRRGSKGIGRKKRRTKLQDQNSQLKKESQSETSPTPRAFDHSYSSSFTLQTCDYRGNFDRCTCIIHEDDDLPFINLEQSEDFDSDGFSANEFYVILGHSAHRYQPRDNLDLLVSELIQHKFHLLREEIADNESDLNALDFDNVKTSHNLHLLQFYEHGDSLNIKLSLTINANLTPVIVVHGKSLATSHPVYSNRSKVYNFSDVMVLLHSVSDYFICVGNFEEEFRECFSGKGNAYLEEYNGARYAATIRADGCDFLTSGARCSACQSYRVYLRKQRQKKRKSLDNKTVTLSSSKPNSVMTHEELAQKTKLLKAQNRSLDNQNKRLREKISKMLDQHQYEELSETSLGEIDKLVGECAPDVESLFPNASSFQRLFWDEQMKFNKCKSKSSMRWHPLIIKWALLIKSKSSKAYQAIREQGFINLPSERTLYDYSHYRPSKIGLVEEAVAMLQEECERKGMFDEEWSPYVGLLQDEIKVKDDLVYCPTTGQLVGYVDLDKTSNQILKLERGINATTDTKSTSRELATSALVLMVRGVTTNLKFPLAVFATHALGSNQLHNIIWLAIQTLELTVGLKVLFTTCDGAGQNRKVFNMHGNGNSSDGEPINSTSNPYASDDRQIYFISDVPHLLKTARNCFSNSQSHHMSRLLWNNGQNILWTHIVNLYTEHIETSMYSKSKLTRAHIDLTPFSRMKVNLAAQVFSKKVAAHLKDVYGEDVRETVRFIEHMNRFFDCLNTRNLYEGQHKINDDLNPYTDENDPRLSYLENDFLGFFEEWQSSVSSREGNFTKQDRDKMQLSQQTLDGLKITVRSIVACVRLLLKKGAPFILTEVFNQDPLEQHFGHYRHKGGACHNPTINDIRHTMNSLRVVGSTALASLNGNTERRKSDHESLISSASYPLPRKKSRPNSL